MSKKRKTKKEKLKAATRHVTITQNSEIHADHEHISYNISDITPVKTIKTAKQPTLSTTVDLTKFIQQDIRKILIASVGIFAFNVILFALLHLNMIKLGFLGY